MIKMADEKRVAIVTGSSSGIGAATAGELASHGWRVVMNYSKSRAEPRKRSRSPPGGREAIRGAGRTSRQDTDCRRLVQAALDKWGRLDALVNNAGTTKFVPHTDLDGLNADDFQRIFATNVIAAVPDGAALRRPS